MPDAKPLGSFTQRFKPIVADLSLRLAGVALIGALGLAGIYLYPFLAGFVLVMMILALVVRLLLEPFLPARHRHFSAGSITPFGLVLACFTTQVALLALLAPWFAAVYALYHAAGHDALNIPHFRLVEAPYGVSLLALFHVAAGVCGIVVSMAFLAVDIPWRLQQARQVENLPRSKARSAAVGLVELYGVARSPLQPASADAQQAIIAPWWSGGATRRFHLEDETGRILVDPRRAQVIGPVAFHLGGVSNEITLRPHIAADGKHRHSIMDGDPVYVLGNAQIDPEAPADTTEAAALVVRPLETPWYAGTIWRLIFGSDAARLAADPENIFVLANGPERAALRIIRKRVIEAVVIASLWVGASAWLVWMELPRVEDLRGWTLSEYNRHAPPDVGLPIIIDHLTSPSAVSRTQALNILWARRDLFKNPPPWAGDLVPGLLRALDGGDRHARDFAGYALSYLKAHADVIVPQAIARVRAQDGGLRAAAINVLRGLANDPPTIVPVLAAALQDEDATVRAEACHALAVFELGASTALDCLQGYLDSPDRDVRRRAIYDLTYLKNPPAERLLPLLRGLLNGRDEMFRYHAAIGINLPGAAAEPALPELLEALRVPNHPGRVFVVRTVAEIGPPAAGAVPLLLPVLEASPGEHYLRQDIIRALARIGTGAAAAIPLLETIAKTDMNSPTRDYAARALREIRRPPG